MTSGRIEKNTFAKITIWIQVKLAAVYRFGSGSTISLYHELKLTSNIVFVVFHLTICWCFPSPTSIYWKQRAGSPLNLRVGGLPVACFTRLSGCLSLSVCTSSCYHPELWNYEASCLCGAMGLEVLAIFSVTSLCFAKEHRADKRGVRGEGGADPCLPDCGKNAGTGTGAGKTRRWLRGQRCV